MSARTIIEYASAEDDQDERFMRLVNETIALLQKAGVKATWEHPGYIDAHKGMVNIVAGADAGWQIQRTDDDLSPEVTDFSPRVADQVMKISKLPELQVSAADLCAVILAALNDPT